MPLAIGSDADIVVFDPKKSATLGVKTLHMKVDYNPYEGRTVQGAPAFVICNGTLVVDGDAFVGRNGAGRFLARGPSRHRPGCNYSVLSFMFSVLSRGFYVLTQQLNRTSEPITELKTEN